MHLSKFYSNATQFSCLKSTCNYSYCEINIYYFQCAFNIPTINWISYLFSTHIKISF